jgi:impB/mucB/samB family C-terminal domain
MTCVCLWSPDWPIAAGHSTELAARLLSHAPRIRLERDVVWADARGLDGRLVAERLLQEARRGDGQAAGGGRADGSTAGRVEEPTGELESGWWVSAGVASTPVAAEAAARSVHPSARLAVVPPDTDRAFLAPLDLGMLHPLPPPNLYPLLAGTGLECCGDLARLDRESVEVRFGVEGVRLWRLARADDDRLLFSPRARSLPDAELEWVDYELERQEQVVFIVHSLLGTVCDALAARGEGAHALALEFALSDRSAVVHPLHASTPTADRRTWLRIVRATLERVTFSAPVTKIALRVEALTPLADRQGDLFDQGFATARATEAALAHLLDKQDDALVEAERTEHPLPERRVRWRAVQTGPAPHTGRRAGALRERPAPRLALALLESPRAVQVRSSPRQDGEAPTWYRDGGVVFSIRDALGPDRISGGYGESRYDREYFQGIRADGVPVLLYRDLTDNRWYLAGWWD